MFTKFIDFFIPRDKRDVPEVYRKHKLVVTIIFLTALFDLQYSGLTIMIAMPQGTVITLFTFVVHSSLLLFARADLSLLKLTNLYVFFGVLSVLGCTYFSGGFNSPVLPWLASSPIVAMLMAGRTTGTFWLVVNSLAVIVFSALHQQGYVFPKNYNPEWRDFFFTNCYSGLVVIIFLVSLVYENGKNTALRKLAQKSILLAEEKRKTALNQVSQEIHDSVGQTLSIIKMNLHLADILKDQKSERLSDSLDLLGKAIQNLRGISHELYNDELMEKDLIHILESEVTTLSKVGVFKTTLNIQGDHRPLARQTEFMLSRIAKEAISNILHHADASHIEISLRYDPEALKLEIRDDGIGMDLDKLNTSGLGLRSMVNRVKLIGGDLQVESTPNKGTSIIIRIREKSEEFFVS